MVTERRKDELAGQGFLEELEGSTHIPGTPKWCMSLVCLQVFYSHCYGSTGVKPLFLEKPEAISGLQTCLAP